MKKIFFILLILLGSGIAAADVDCVLINSASWEDVYSGMLYAGFTDVPARFLLSEGHGTQIMDDFDRSVRQILLIESTRVPYALNYEYRLTSEGFRVIGIRAETDSGLNLELSQMLRADSFIVVDDSYGHGAVSVAPYAIANNSFVLFASRENIDVVYSYLSGIEIEHLLLYGKLDKEVREALAEFDPDVINNGNRFDDNIEIVERFMEAYPTEQVILTDGQILEPTIIQGEHPVLFIGRDDVPPQVIDYVQDNEENISVGVVVGSGMEKASRKFKDYSNLSVFIKFGQGLPGEGIQDLDVFRLPVHEFDLEIVSTTLNLASSQVEVVYTNNAEIDTYLISTVTVYSDGEHVATTGDIDPVLVLSGQTLPVAYDVSLDGAVSNLMVEVTSRIGEYERSQSVVITDEMEVAVVEVEDFSGIEVTGATYDKGDHKIRVDVKNTGPEGVYISPRVSVTIYGDERVLSKDEPIFLEDGVEVEFIVDLSDTNLEENEMVFVHVNYGKSSGSMIKVYEDELPLEVSSDLVPDGLGLGSPMMLIQLVILLIVCKVFGRRIKK